MSNSSDATCGEFDVAVEMTRLVTVSVSRQIKFFSLYVLEVCGKTRSHTTFFRRRVDADKDEVSLLNRLVNVG